MEFIARLLLMTMFSYASIANLMNADTMKKMMEEKNIPYTDIIFPLSMIGMLLASIAIIFNILIVFSAFYLMVFMGVVTFYFADFWNTPADKREMVIYQFVTNVTIIGALLLLILFSFSK